MTNSDRLYFDYAATSFPKPKLVASAMTRYLENAGNPGRGAHGYAMFGARQIMEGRETIARFLNVVDEERLIFTPGCTYGLNFVIKGLAQQEYFQNGDTVLLSGLEHNSVTRPLEQIKSKIEIEIKSMGVVNGHGEFLTELEDLLSKGEIKLCVLTHASNVTGQLLPVDRAATICKKFGVPTLVDAAQTAGKLAIELSDSDISFWASSGHKGLMGPPGVGLLYVGSHFQLDPVITGGTGSNSEALVPPEVLPDRLEAGTPPGPNIAGLKASVEYVGQKNLFEELEKELSLVESFLDWAAKLDQISVFGPDRCFEEGVPVRMPTISFSMDGISPGELSSILDCEYGIAVRPGLHCAALMHTNLGTIDKGLTRVSFGPQNSFSQLEKLFSALTKISKIQAKI